MGGKWRDGGREEEKVQVEKENEGSNSKWKERNSSWEMGGWKEIITREEGEGFKGQRRWTDVGWMKAR